VPVVTASSYADNAWHHLVLTRSQGTGSLQLYVDGALQGSAPIALPVSTGPATLRLGRGVTAAGGYFSGLLDEVAWYDVVLGEQTVAAHQLAAR
jgi:sialidase-1